MAIDAPLANTNLVGGVTFDDWRIRTNETIARLNSIARHGHVEGKIGTGDLNSNTLTSNSALIVSRLDVTGNTFFTANGTITGANLYLFGSFNDPLGGSLYVQSNVDANTMVVNNAITANLVISSGSVISGNGVFTFPGPSVVVASDISHLGEETTNLLRFDTTSQAYLTGGSERMSINNSGVQLGASGARVTTVLDEDDFLSDSATALTTQQAAGAYIRTGTFTMTNKTLTSPTINTPTITSPVLDLPQINDTSDDHQYIFAVNELTADRTVTLPLLGADDEFTFNDATQTLTNKTLTSPTLNSPSIDAGTFSTSATFNSAVDIASALRHDGETDNNFEFTAGTQTFDIGGTMRMNLTASGLQLASGARINEFSTDGTLAGLSDTAAPTELATHTALTTGTFTLSNKTLASAVFSGTHSGVFSTTSNITSTVNIAANTGYVSGQTVYDNSNRVLTTGKHSVWLGAGAFQGRTTAAQSETFETTTNVVPFRAFRFDPSTVENCGASIVLPKSYNDGSIDLHLYWSPVDTNTGNVIWRVYLNNISIGDAIDNSFATSTVFSASAAGGSAAWRRITATSVTKDATWAEGDLFQILVRRDASSGSDTYASDARFHGLMLIFNVGLPNDD